MKILFVAPRFHTNQYQLVKTLQEHHHQVYFHVSYLGPTEDYTLLTPDNFRQSRVSEVIEKILTRRVIRRPHYYYFPNILEYWEGFKALSPDLVIIRDPYTLFSVIAAFCAYFLNVKVIFYTQEDIYRPRTRFTAFKQHLTNEFFKAAWITPIKGSSDTVAKGIKHMYYFPLPIAIQPKEQAQKKAPIVEPALLMIGKYHQDRKKHLLLIEAANQLKQNYNFKLTIVGECVTAEQVKKYRMLEEKVQQLGLTEIVQLKSNIPFHEMKEIYNSHHVFVLPSINEQYGISVVEALSYGLPVVCTDTCGARIHITNGWNGYITKSSSLASLTDALAGLLSNDAKISAMSGNALDYVQANLSSSICYERLREILSERFDTDLERAELAHSTK